jgi:hypothetical protein
MVHERYCHLCKIKLDNELYYIQIDFDIFFVCRRCKVLGRKPIEKDH